MVLQRFDWLRVGRFSANAIGVRQKWSIGVDRVGTTLEWIAKSSMVVHGSNITRAITLPTRVHATLFALGLKRKPIVPTDSRRFLQMAFARRFRNTETSNRLISQLLWTTGRNFCNKTTMKRILQPLPRVAIKTQDRRYSLRCSFTGTNIFKQFTNASFR